MAYGLIGKASETFVERKNQYIWLTIYSDLITNLFILFVALYSLSYFGPDAIQDAMASMKNRLEYSTTAVPWYEDITRNLKVYTKEDAPVIAREDRLQIALPEDVIFQPGQGDLEDTQQLVLHALALSLKNVPYTILVEGHTDNEPLAPGSRYKSNWELSLARAMAVVKYLVHVEGISPKRMGIAAFGEYHPRFPNDSRENRMKNRRIEISVLRYE